VRATIKPLGQGLAALSRSTQHIGPHSGDEGLLGQLGADLQPDPLIARISVMQVNR
jgi:hypothetical protein